MSNDSVSKEPIEQGSQKPRAFHLVSFPDGRQLVQIYPLALSIPKHRDRYYRAEVIIGDTTVSGVLCYPPLKALDLVSYVEIVFFIADKETATITTDIINGVKVFRELSQSERESLSLKY